MKGFFKNKSKTPADLVRTTKELLVTPSRNVSHNKEPRKEDKPSELTKNIREIKFTLYGNQDFDPVPDLCAQICQEIYKQEVFRLLIERLPHLELEARKDATQVIANLQRQFVRSRLIASEYLEANMDLIDTLLLGYENADIALHYSKMLRECIRHQCVASYVLEPRRLQRFFTYIELPDFAVASDAVATFKELLTRHKSTVAELLWNNYDWFFNEYNSKLLQSPNYITRRQALKLLGDMFIDKTNASVTSRYVSSKDNLCLMMNLLRDSSKSIQFDAFHVFKLFVANQKKPQEIISILITNRNKLLRFFSDFKSPEKDDEQFDQDKAKVVKEIANLASQEQP